MLEANPAFTLAQVSLAMLCRGKLPEADLAAMERQLTRTTLSGDNRSQLLFALAHVLDARGNYRRAANCCARRTLCVCR